MRARPLLPGVLNQIAFPRSGILPVSTRVSILSRSFTSRCTPEAGQFDKVRRNYREKVEGKQCAPLQSAELSIVEAVVSRVSEMSTFADCASATATSYAAFAWS